jgi:hypothetical protein
MMLGLFNSARGKTKRRTIAAIQFRPTLERIEDRVVPSAMSIATPAFAAALAAPTPNAHHLAPVHMLPLHIQNVSFLNGQLMLNGTLKNNPFQIPLTLSTSPNAADPTCPILNLEIPQGIHLDLLGLNVDTSAICLSITGESGPGNLLGNLVCDLSNALNPGGAGLLGFLNGLSTKELNTLLHGLSNVLKTAITDLTTVQLGGTSGATPTVTGTTTNILHLSLGPVNLNVLGLDVSLDNCAGGPVTVDITATTGNGNLLGNLLSDLANLLNGNASLRSIEHALRDVAGAIGHLI